MDAFSDDYRVVAIDLGGHGNSGTGRAAYTTDSFRPQAGIGVS